MIYGVTFGDKHTWADWKILPIARPVIAFPPVKTNIINIIGADGQIDLMDVVVGAPVYGNRTGSLSFRMVDKSGETSVLKRKNEIAHYLHGLSMRMVLDEEPEWYYYGKFSVDTMTYKGKGDFADIVIKYDLEPYKRRLYTTDEQYLWDTFSFDDGVVYDGLIVNAEVSSTEDPVIIENFDAIVGDLPIRPTVVISDNTTNITFKRLQSGTWDTTGYVYMTGTNVQPSSGTAIGLKFDRFTTALSVAGVGKFSLIFRQGAL